MRTLGIFLAVLGVPVLLINWIGGVIFIIIGLLLMIAAPDKVKTEPAKPSSHKSTGGYAGFAKKKHSEFDLGDSPHLGQRKQEKSGDPWGNKKFIG